MAYVTLLRQLDRAAAEEGRQIETSEEEPSRSPIESRSPVLGDLAGKRALILGDSVDRYMLMYLRDEVTNDARYFSECDMDDSRVLKEFGWTQGAPRMMVIPIVPPPGTTEQEFDFANDVDVNQSPEFLSSGRNEAQVELVAKAKMRAQAQLRVDFMHMYGTDDDDLWEDRASHQEVTAWRTQDRLEKVKTMWGAEPDTYHAVFINFGLWELARYQRTAYDLHSSDDEIGLPQEWLEDFKNRLRMYVERVQTAWSQAKVVIRTIHDPRENAGGWFRSANMNAGGVRRAPFTRLRVVQLRRAQVQVAQELGLDVLHWADHMIGQDDSWLKDELHPGIPGSLVLAEMYLRMLAETRSDLGQRQSLRAWREDDV
ncbi:hypothetical protein FFLO_03821 [Filobasidium floriforme]|uniref:Uncharacterized protein n=1 Tax=Filobasidium floriforme TaxID=5210 RepID=A0A8K0JK71_9TREE|nr:uncharacterized protein HD553DRAFT_353466 [Filobasidium floriforme]XP_046035856.1 uncharacterized protein HD553DRAFT_350903 [Filobasidium floriforme]KAG7532133.1 hypothetical protein FFLO_03821 [Filobasidium floriforme]KAH8077056.1 hypothetical protein HD553DRAFT_353466 [Filobasidium floriforme]KAH8083275.1 hypothetical protein HD553DRAFT_350903 [Filobasidium floriforme]